MEAAYEPMLVYRCWQCRALATACPYCVVSVRIDPTTGLPPDLERDGDSFRRIPPDPEALARSHREPLCESCALRAGAPETDAERHRRYCRALP